MRPTAHLGDAGRSWGPRPASAAVSANPTQVARCGAGFVSPRRRVRFVATIGPSGGRRPGPWVRFVHGVWRARSRSGRVQLAQGAALGSFRRGAGFVSRRGWGAGRSGAGRPGWRRVRFVAGSERTFPWIAHGMEPRRVRGPRGPGRSVDGPVGADDERDGSSDHIEIIRESGSGIHKNPEKWSGVRAVGVATGVGHARGSHLSGPGGSIGKALGGEGPHPGRPRRTVHLRGEPP